MNDDTRQFTMVHARWTVAGLGIASCLLIIAFLSHYLQLTAAGMCAVPAAMFCILFLFISNRHFDPPRLVFMALGVLIGCVGIPLILYHDLGVFVHASGAWRYYDPNIKYGLRFVVADEPIGFVLLMLLWPFVICILAILGFFLGRIFSSIQRK